jgi:hypothetical protein
MTIEPILESGMKFGPFTYGTCFYIEKSDCYRRIQHDVAMAEFLLIRSKAGKSVVWIVEAKSSSPQPKNRDEFDSFVDDIRKKLTNGFLLGMAARLERHEAAAQELPQPFKALDLSHSGFLFVLVVNGHKRDWLPPLQEALARALTSVVKTWGLNPTSVIVLNEVLAKEHSLILPA